VVSVILLKFMKNPSEYSDGNFISHKLATASESWQGWHSTLAKRRETVKIRTIFAKLPS
jgi:hypothetical protein